MQRIIFRAIVAGQAAVSGVAHGVKPLGALCADGGVANDQFASTGTKPLAER